MLQLILYYPLDANFPGSVNKKSASKKVMKYKFSEPLALFCLTSLLFLGT